MQTIQTGLQPRLPAVKLPDPANIKKASGTAAGIARRLLLFFYYFADYSLFGCLVLLAHVVLEAALMSPSHDFIRSAFTVTTISLVFFGFLFFPVAAGFALIQSFGRLLPGRLQRIIYRHVPSFYQLTVLYTGVLYMVLLIHMENTQNQYIFMAFTAALALLSRFFTSKTAAVMYLLLLIGSSGYYLSYAVPRGWFSSAAAGKSPNVLLIVSDTTRRDHMGFNGHSRNTTPFLDSIAEKGSVFSNTVSASAFTKPATSALLTSQFLTSDNIHRRTSELKYQGETMAEFYNNAGYDTALFTANANASSYFGISRGYNYRLHSLPTSHGSIRKFTVVRFIDDNIKARTSQFIKNTSNTLKDFGYYLNMTPGQLEQFAAGKLNSTKKLSAGQASYLRRQIAYLLHQKKKRFREDNTRQSLSLKSDRSMFKQILPLIKANEDYITEWYVGALEFNFFTRKAADGTIVQHWLKDHQLSRSFIDWDKNIRDKDEPFFVHMQYMGAHDPYETQLPYLFRHFDPGHKTPKHRYPMFRTPSTPAPRYNEVDHYNLQANYNDSIRITDANIKMVIDYLSDSGQLSNTLVIFTADHGEAFYEHNIYGHVYSLHSEMVNVPLFFYWENRIKPAVSSIPVSLVDVFPSVLNLTGFSEDVTVMNLKGTALFKPDGRQYLKERDEYYFALATLIDRNVYNPEPDKFYGFHRGFIFEGGKFIEETERSRTRYYFYPAGEKYEYRRPMTRQQLEERDLDHLVNRLPPHPSYWPQG